MCVHLDVLSATVWCLSDWGSKVIPVPTVAGVIILHP